MRSGVCGADLVQEKSEVEDMGKEAVWDMVQQLQAGLQAREKQLERQGEQLANMQEVQQQLQVCCPHPNTCLNVCYIAHGEFARHHHSCLSLCIAHSYVLDASNCGI